MSNEKCPTCDVLLRDFNGADPEPDGPGLACPKCGWEPEDGGRGTNERLGASRSALLELLRDLRYLWGGYWMERRMEQVVAEMRVRLPRKGFAATYSIWRANTDLFTLLCWNHHSIADEYRDTYGFAP